MGRFALTNLWYRIFSPGTLIQKRYGSFKALLEKDSLAHDLMARLQSFYEGEPRVELSAVEAAYEKLSETISGMIEDLQRMNPGQYTKLSEVFRSIDASVRKEFPPHKGDISSPLILRLDEVPSGAKGILGAKAWNLSRIAMELKLPIPPGFVITTRAFHLFCERNQLQEKIAPYLAQLDVSSAQSLEDVSRKITALIDEAVLPQKLVEAMDDSLEEIAAEDTSSPRFAVRSSAIGEDEYLSFAGQFTTVLDVEPRNLSEAYKTVIAGKYTPHALHYLVRNGLIERETPMAALVMRMLDAEVSGVVYSRDPVAPDSKTVKVYAVQGQGESLVSGKQAPHIVEVTRALPHEVVRSCQVNLDDESAKRLATWAIQLESHFRAIQDIEWCKDRKGNLYLLQSRPLRVDRSQANSCVVIPSAIRSELLVSEGEKAAGGVDAGQVFVLSSPSDFKSIPPNTVLVAHTTSPAFAQVLPRLRAVVTDIGSIADHFASVAREAGLPTLVNTRFATSVLKHGAMVTVDADHRKVFAGIVEELLNPACREEEKAAESPFRQHVRRMLDSISPLNLIEPRSPGFSQENCRTFHDIIRYAHEKAIEEMFYTTRESGSSLRGARKLVSDIPVSLYVLDLGEGLGKNVPRGKEIRLSDVVSPSLRALWKGLSHPGIAWPQEVRHMDWGELSRVAEGGGIISLNSQLLASFAITSQEYLNANIRFGYHFAVIDSFCSKDPRKNYVSLRFEGGGGTYDGRRLRILFLSRILEAHGFEVHMERDIIHSQLRTVSDVTVESKLELIGYLLAFTPLKDMELYGIADVETLTTEFERGHAAL